MYEEADKESPFHKSYGPELIALIRRALENPESPATADQVKFLLGNRLLYEGVRLHLQQFQGYKEQLTREKIVEKLQDTIRFLVEEIVGPKDAEEAARWKEESDRLSKSITEGDDE